MMRCASGDRRRKDDFFIWFANNEKATKLQVIENMQIMVQLNNSRKHAQKKRRLKQIKI